MIDLETLPSAWKGHGHFSQWLIKKIGAEITVDLGVDYGYSTLMMASAGVGHVYGVDTFTGDLHSGGREADAHYKGVIDVIQENQISNVTMIRDTFEATAARWDKPIDLLHIDGFHEYQAVHSDIVNWLPHMKSTGAIMFHDTCLHADVMRAVTEIDAHIVNFQHSFGLGIATLDPQLKDSILKTFHDAIDISIPPGRYDTNLSRWQLRSE